MQQHMTKLRYWYETQDEQTKQKFIKDVAAQCGVSERSAYRYLDGGAPKLTKHILNDLSKICTSELYNPIIETK